MGIEYRKQLLIPSKLDDGRCDLICDIDPVYKVASLVLLGKYKNNPIQVDFDELEERDIDEILSFFSDAKKALSEMRKEDDA